MLECGISCGEPGSCGYPNGGQEETTACWSGVRLDHSVLWNIHREHGGLRGYVLCGCRSPNTWWLSRDILSGIRFSVDCWTGALLHKRRISGSTDLYCWNLYRSDALPSYVWAGRPNVAGAGAVTHLLQFLKELDLGVFFADFELGAGGCVKSVL